jgi:hypothetical protein
MGPKPHTLDLHGVKIAFIAESQTDETGLGLPSVCAPSGLVIAILFWRAVVVDYLPRKSPLPPLPVLRLTVQVSGPTGLSFVVLRVSLGSNPQPQELLLPLELKLLPLVRMKPVPAELF